MTKEEKRQLIKMAARILLSTTAPSPYLSDHQMRPKRVPIRWWRTISQALRDAEEERRLWAIELRIIADGGPWPAERELRRESRHAKGE